MLFSYFRTLLLALLFCPSLLISRPRSQTQTQMGPWKDWRGNWSCPASIVPRKKVCDKNRNASILDQQERGRMKLFKSILKSSKEKAVQRKTIDNRAAKTMRVTPSSSQVRQMLLWHISFGEPGQWPPLCRCFWRRLDGLDRQLLTLPRLSIRDLPPRACRGGNTDASHCKPKPIQVLSC